METGGDAYLKTPDDELSFLVRNSIDTHASVGALVGLVVLALWKLSRVFIRNARVCPGKHQFALVAQCLTSKEKKIV